jgi:molybdopterin synthase sulfur carrier subunit
VLTIHYFASVREALGKADEQLEFPDDIVNVGGLMKYLGAVNPAFQSLIASENKILVAVNQIVVDRNYVLSKNDEVAFFPPMTGG